jgi:hypothetical protein
MSQFGIGMGGHTDLPAKTFYEKMVYESMMFWTKRGAKHEEGVEIEGIIPEAAESCRLGNRHRQCKYYKIGVDVCHTSMLVQNADNFLACKEPVDAMWRCYTEEKYG